MLYVDSHLLRLTELYVDYTHRNLTITKFWRVLFPVEVSIWIIPLLAVDDDISTPFVLIVEETRVKNAVYELEYFTLVKLTTDPKDTNNNGKLGTLAVIFVTVRSKNITN